MKYICKTKGFSIKGYTKENPEKNKKITIKNGDIVETDNEGYMWKDNICFCHSDSILGHYHFEKLN